MFSNNSLLRLLGQSNWFLLWNQEYLFC